MDTIQWDGKKIGKPGLYSGIPLEKYHGDLCVGPSISSTGLRTIISKSPAHYWDGSIYNPNAEIPEPSEAMILGAAAHLLLLGEVDFRRRFVMRPPEFENWRTKASQEWRAKQELEGYSVLTDSDADRITGMARAFASDPLIKQGILAGHVERSLIWQDKLTEVWVKVRPDSMPIDHQEFDFVDIKTASSVLDEDLQSSMHAYRYDMQAGLMAMAAQALFGQLDVQVAFVFIESKRPHCISIKVPKPSSMKLGVDSCRVALNTFAHCMASNVWQGPAGMKGDFAFIEPSKWQREQEELRNAQLAQEIKQ